MVLYRKCVLKVSQIHRKTPVMKALLDLQVNSRQTINLNTKILKVLQVSLDLFLG